MAVRCVVAKPEPCRRDAATVVQVRIEPSDDQGWIVREAPAPLCIEHHQDYMALDPEGRRWFAFERGIEAERRRHLASQPS